MVFGFIPYLLPWPMGKVHVFIVPSLPSDPTYTAPTLQVCTLVSILFFFFYFFIPHHLLLLSFNPLPTHNDGICGRSVAPRVNLSLSSKPLPLPPPSRPPVALRP